MTMQIPDFSLTRNTLASLIIDPQLLLTFCSVAGQKSGRAFKSETKICWFSWEDTMHMGVLIF